MKSKDLMVGDWVNYRPGWIDEETGKPEYECGEGFPVKITCIYDGLAQYDDMLPDGTINTIEVADYELSGIPLTPEILEKNGFRFDGSGRRSMMFISEPHFADGIRFNIYVGLKHKTIEVFAAHPVEKSPNWRKSNKVYLEVCGCYVHELQHALRLCGIDKTIEL